MRKSVIAGFAVLLLILAVAFAGRGWLIPGGGYADPEATSVDVPPETEPAGSTLHDGSAAPVQEGSLPADGNTGQSGTSSGTAGDDTAGGNLDASTPGSLVESVVDEVLDAASSQYEDAEKLGQFTDLMSDEMRRNSELAKEAYNFDHDKVGTGEILGGCVSSIFCPKDDDWLTRYEETVGKLETYIYRQFPDRGMPEYVEVYPYGENHLVECRWNTGTLLYYEMYLHPRTEQYEMRLYYADPSEVEAMRNDYLEQQLESIESMDQVFRGVVE